MLIKAAINGGRAKAEHPRVPVSPTEIANDIVECLAAGVAVIHLHVRSGAGIQSLDAEDVGRTIAAARVAAPAAALGVSTGAWIVPGEAARLKAIDTWQVVPDFASVNFIEAGAAELSECLLSQGVGIEAGLSDIEAANIFIESHLASRCLRVLIEPQEQELEAALETIRRIEARLDENRINLERVLHGTELTVWPLLREALTRGYGIRIGFEDTLLLSDGTTARSNADLIADALRLRDSLAA